MRIVHVSYAVIRDIKPEDWLNKISFFTGILRCQANEHEVVSVHCSNTTKLLIIEKVAYHFINVHCLETLSPLQVNHYIKKTEPDVVIVHGLLFPWHVISLYFQLGHKTKIYLQHHAERPQRNIKALLQKLADKYVEGYFFTSLGLARPWIEVGQIKNARKIHEVMEVSSTFQQSMQESNKKNADNLSYLWIGRLDANKDPITLVKAFRKFSDRYPLLKLTIIFQTDGLLKEVKHLIEQCPAISLIGKVDHHRLPEFFLRSDFIISTSHYEGSGLAVCEGMSFGCIPIVSDLPSFQAMVNHECGLLFAAGDEASLHEALDQSLLIDRLTFKKKVLEQFENKLSFAVIAKKINRTILTSLQ